jgi:type IV pilus assembly protein PilN
MRIDINLATQPYEDSRRFWTYWGTCLALLAMATALLVFLAVTGFLNGNKDRTQAAKLQQEIAAYDEDRGRAEAVLNQPQNRVLRDRSRFLNSLFQRKAFSWTRVFEDLEQVMPPRLHVVSIHPDMSSDNSLEIKLIVAGDSRDQAIELVRKMEGSNHFRQTFIASQRESEENTSGDKVEFELEALYVPSGEKNATTSSAAGGLN